MTFQLGKFLCPKCKVNGPLKGRRRIANAYLCATCMEKIGKTKGDVRRPSNAEQNNATVSGL